MMMMMMSKVNASMLKFDIPGVKTGSSRLISLHGMFSKNDNNTCK